jgi:hypothetical protein
MALLLLLLVDELQILGVLSVLVSLLLLLVDILKILEVLSLLVSLLLLLPLEMLGILGVLSLLVSLLLLLVLVGMLKSLEVADMELSVLARLLSSIHVWLLALSLSVCHLHHSGCRHLSPALLLSAARPSLACLLPL